MNTVNQRRAEVKLALARKYTHLAKITPSRPKQARWNRKAEGYRRQAADLLRL